MIEELEQLNSELEKRNKEIYEGFMATTEELCEVTKEIERLKNINEEHRILNGELRKELQQKENIMKEVREYIEEMQIWLVDFEDFGITTKGLLEILDKEKQDV